eukprot:jgi/Mesvir1/26275/Mv01639-RA.1
MSRPPSPPREEREIPMANGTDGHEGDHDPNEPSAFVRAMEEVGRRYTFDFDPLWGVKLRKSTLLGSFGIDYVVGERTWNYVYKTPKVRWARRKAPLKVVLTPHENDIRVETAKLPISLFCLQLVVGHDYATKATGVRWRVTSKWGISGTAERKEKLTLFPGLEAHMHWDAAVSWPEVDGSVGVGERQVEVDAGSVHVSIPRIDAVIRL